MMLVGGARDAPLRVALVTTHLALADVPGRDHAARPCARRSPSSARELRAHFGIAAPRIAVCGLNPHAGEGGHLGREEIDVIAPAIARGRARRRRAVDGPLPADTVFVPEHARSYDAIVAMYHDQGLPVLKAASFGRGVNVTLGLAVHAHVGRSRHRARPRASTPRARAPRIAGSLVAAVELAIELAQRRERRA